MSGMWGGRFSEQQNDVFTKFNSSFSFDVKLFFYDIIGSLAYADALFTAKILSSDEHARIISGLKQLENEAISKPNMLFEAVDEGYEDVHGFVEAKLTELIGAAAKKLHTGRSRNDQVATDLRLYVRDAIDESVSLIASLQKTLVDRAEAEQKVILPGFTHLQKAQAISWAHFLLSYFEMLERDKERLLDMKKRVNVLPLGSGALAGNNYPIDRHAIAKALGFDSISTNSLDATSDRDFIAEFLFSSSLLMTHLSRFSEDLIIYCSSEYAYVEMSDLVSTGSSLMPQKKNPDALELIRGKSGRIFGNLVGILTVLKGLPSCYNKDLQEDKEGLFDTAETLFASLKTMDIVIKSLKVNEDTMLKACKTGYLNATDLADYLVAKGIAFRQAHHTVGEIVQHAIKNDSALEDLSLEDMKQFEAKINDDVYESLDLQNVVNTKNTPGGTSFNRVSEAIQAARKKCL